MQISPNRNNRETESLNSFVISVTSSTEIHFVPSPSLTLRQWPSCFQNPDNSLTECRVFLAASLWAIQKTIVLSIVGILFALSAVKNEQLKHAEKSKCNQLTTASNSIRFFINPSCRCLSRVLQLVPCLPSERCSIIETERDTSHELSK
jgi:hypothetical protein